MIEIYIRNSIITFKEKNSKTVLILGSVFFAIPVLFYSVTGFSIGYMSKEDLEKIMQKWAPDSIDVYK